MNKNMNKYVKGFLFFFGAIFLPIAFFTGWFTWSLGDKKDRAEEDTVKYSTICDTITIITEKPSIALGEFNKFEIDQLKFYLIRNNKVIQDTLVLYEITNADNYLWTEIPFTKFRKSDTIIVETKDNAKRYYRISGFRYYGYLHYGMFGSVGSHDCRFDNNNYIVNGEPSNGTLLKQEGIKENIIPK